MVRVILVILAVHLGTNSPVNAQTCNSSLSGIVRGTGGELLSGASVIVVETANGTATSDRGSFKIAKLCPGRYTIEVSYVGYRSQRKKVNVSGETTTDFNLEPGVTELEAVEFIEEPSYTNHATNLVSIGEKVLQENAGKTLGESLKEIAGVNTIQAGPGIFKPVVHGVSGQRVLILNYGIRQEGQQWGTEHAPEIDPFVASEVIVIKDASAIKYGTDALGGVIVVNPPDLSESKNLGGSVNTIYQSNGRSGIVSGMLEGGSGKWQGLGWRLQGTGKRTGDFNTPHYQLTNTGVRELNFSGAVGYHRAHYGGEIYFSHFQTQLGILKGTSISSLDDLVNAIEREPPQYTSPFSYTIGEPRQSVEHNLLKISGHFETKVGRWNATYAFQNNQRREFDIRLGGLSKTPVIDLKLNTHLIELEWTVKSLSKMQMSFGANSHLQENSNVPGTLRIPFIPNYFSTTLGAFAVSKIQLDKWIVDVGLRYDRRHSEVTGYDFKNTLYSSVLNFGNMSFTMGTQVKMRNGKTITSNLSSSWRPPHVAELYSLGTHQSAAAIEYGLLLNDKTNEVMNVNDVNFKVENALKWVSSYRYRANDLFDAEITAYANYIFNYIYLKPTGVTQNIRGVYPYFRYNQTDAFFTGIDLSAYYMVVPSIKISSRASILSSKDMTNHDFLVFIPSNKLDVEARYTTVLKKVGTFSLISKVRYVDKQRRAPHVLTVREIKEATEKGEDVFAGNTSNFDFLAPPPAYMILNLAASLSVKNRTGKYDVRISCDNVLNTSYREYTNRFRYFADELGRNVTVSLKYSF